MSQFGHAMLEYWAFEPNLLYLNHGTVGAPPRRVLEAQQHIRDEIERQPARFMLRELSEIAIGQPAEQPRLRAAADHVAQFMGARGQDLVFVDNATTGVNAVLGSLIFNVGDDILVTNLGYGGVVNAAVHAARRGEVRVNTVQVPLPARDAKEFKRLLAKAITPRTRLAILDHITSESALVLPLAELVDECHQRGVAVVVDGAHVPAALPLDIPAIGADWYTGNLHKWAYAPRSCGFLWAHPDRQKELRPPVTSWGLDQSFAAQFDWVGTRDPSANLAAPVGIEFLREFGEEAVRGYNHALVWQAAQLLAKRWNTQFETPESMIATMATVPLPSSFGTTHEAAISLRNALWFEDRIEVAVHSAQDQLWVRICAQIYNEISDFETLAQAVARRS